MTFDEHLEQLITLLQREGRMTYRALKRRLNVEDDYLADLTAEIIEAKRLAVDENGKVLVWVGASPVSGSTFQVENSSEFGVRSSESEAEECFLKAIEIARKQQAKSLELRAATSLTRF